MVLKKTPTNVEAIGVDPALGSLDAFPHIQDSQRRQWPFVGHLDGPRPERA